MLRWRLTLGTLFILVLMGLFALDHSSSVPGVILYPLALLLSVMISREMLWLYAGGGLHPLGWVVYVGGLLVVGSNAFPLFAASDRDSLIGIESPCAAMGLCVLLAFLGEMRRYSGPGGVVQRLGLSLLAIGYGGLLLSFLVQMRLIGAEGDSNWGVPAIASLLIVVKLGDIGAYTFGRLFGRRKMAPVLSPGKTLEGAAGGLVLACLGSWLALNQLGPWMANEPLRNPWAWVPYGLAVGLAGMFGDLAESLIKRDLGRKDSSDWLPGFGGVLDLLDSVLFAAPVAFVFWRMGWVGG